MIGLDPTLLYEIRHESENGFTPVPAGSTELSGIPFGFVEIRHPAAGDARSAVELSPDELSRILPDAEWIDVCKLPEAAE